MEFWVAIFKEVLLSRGRYFQHLWYAHIKNIIIVRIDLRAIALSGPGNNDLVLHVKLTVMQPKQ